MSVPLPALFGKYQLLSHIAEGGMADVYLGRLTGPGGFEKRLVIKVIRPELAQRREFCELFVAEAKITVALNHANIVPVYELGMADGQYYLAMELVDGPTIHQLIFDPRPRRGGALPAPLAAYVVEQALRGLDYAHRQGVIHCDLSSANVMCSREGEVKILDFGIAAHAHATQWSVPDGQMVGRMSGQMSGGSLGYMAPEQQHGAPPNQRTDLYAVGVLLFEVATGRRFLDDPAGNAGTPPAGLPRAGTPLAGRPKAGTPLVGTPVLLAAQPPLSLAAALLALPAPLRHAIEVATAFRPEDRYPDASAMLAELSRYLRDVDAPTQAGLSKLVRQRAPDERRPTRSLGMTLEKGLGALPRIATRWPRTPLGPGEDGPHTRPAGPAPRSGDRHDLTPAIGAVRPVLHEALADPLAGGQPGRGGIEPAAERERTPPGERPHPFDRELTPPIGRRWRPPHPAADPGASPEPPAAFPTAPLPIISAAPGAEQNGPPDATIGAEKPLTGEPTAPQRALHAGTLAAAKAAVAAAESTAPRFSLHDRSSDRSGDRPTGAHRALVLPGPGSTVTFASRPARIHATWRTYLGAVVVLAIAAGLVVTTVHGLHRPPWEEIDPGNAVRHPTTGVLNIQLPADARLQVDGRSAQPGVSFSVRAGRHRIAASAPGHSPMMLDIEVRAGETVNERPMLAWSMGQLHLSSSPQGAQVQLNGEAVGTTPLALDIPLDRPALLRLSSKGYVTMVRQIQPSEWVAASPQARVGRPAAEAAAVMDQPAMNLNLALAAQEHGLLTVGSMPWSQVFVDGERRGDTPLRRLALPAGPHALRLYCPPQSCPGGKEDHQNVTVEPGREAHQFVDFRAGRKRPSTDHGAPAH